VVQLHAQNNGDRASDDLSPEFVLQEQELFRVVEETIRRMPMRRREFLLLHRAEGLSYAEIARRTGVSATAVKKHVALAVAACGVALEAVVQPALSSGRDSGPESGEMSPLVLKTTKSSG
jgi:DNA-directed RNA polymerase specialized sigma24 family protein